MKNNPFQVLKQSEEFSLTGEIFFKLEVLSRWRFASPGMATAIFTSQLKSFGPLVPQTGQDHAYSIEEIDAAIMMQTR